VTLSNQSLPGYTLTRENSQTGSEKEQALQSMQEYYQLQRMLFITTIVLTAIVFTPVCFFYSWQIALNYLLGAVVGVFYLKLLAGEVERLGTAKQRLGIKGLVLLAGLIILACTREELQIIPVFLGFMTYKAAIIAHTIRMTVMSLSQAD
jgi:ATP synthase protein I